MLPKAYVIHHLNHRTRIYIPSQRKRDDFFLEVEKSLNRLNQIDQVKTNSLTGTLLIHHEGNLSSISELAEKQGLFKIRGGPDHPHSWTSDMFRRIKRLDTRIVHSTDGSFNLASTTALSLLGLSFLQVLRGQVLPAASTLLFNAYEVLRTAGKDTERKFKRNLAPK